MTAAPDFIVIGAMKCATSTLHEQLARQPGIHMSRPKEPNFFSDDDVYARGIGWYTSLFEAPDAVLHGESSTHYTKLPTHPETISRLCSHLGKSLRFVYVMRHPVDRLVSHYAHEWSQRVTSDPIDLAVDRMPELVSYGCYAEQLAPWFEAFGAERVLPVFFERLTTQPQEQLERVCRFLGYEKPCRWDDGRAHQNRSAQRERPSWTRDALRKVPGVRPLVRSVIPASTRDRIRGRLWRLPAPPTLSAARRTELEARFDDDLATLGAWLGTDLSCQNFKEVADCPDPTWQAAPVRQAA